jgi:hypothetical protein
MLLITPSECHICPVRSQHIATINPHIYGWGFSLNPETVATIAFVHHRIQRSAG